MSSHLYKTIRSGLFRFEPEMSHKIAMQSLKVLNNIPLGIVLAKSLKLIPESTPKNPCILLNLPLPNPVGLGAGFDKDGEYISELFALGFGSIEAGTVTPKPQSGNPQPRCFRLPEHSAIINRMGFNNKGVDNLVLNIKNYRLACEKANVASGIIGVNVGKNAITANENALSDYIYCIKAAHSYADYLTVNISSPNTKNLRDLQNVNSLKPLLLEIRELQTQLNQKQDYKVPLFVKIAPDLSDSEVEEMAEVFAEVNIEGVIATNTTISREEVEHHILADEAGGLSGKPVLEKSNHVLEKLRVCLPDAVIIGVGGISSVDDAITKKVLGADMVQIYTGFVYKGVGLIADITKAW